MGPALAKSLSRLSRHSLVELCLKWTESSTSTPYLTSNRNLLESDEEDYLHEPAEDSAVLKSFYNDLRNQENKEEAFSKKDIIDRIVDGDWRRGLSLQQLADLDFANLKQNDTSLRWSALKLVPFRLSDSPSLHPAKKRKVTHALYHEQHYPTISPASFVANLKSHISPLIKAHYTLHRLSEPSNLVVLRLYIVLNTPFAPKSSNIPRNLRQATDSSRVMYIALPDSCPYVYISLSGSTTSATAPKSKDDGKSSTAKIDIAATKRIILEAIPKAFSKPQERWSLETTKLTCRSLKAIGLLRGNGRPGTAGGCYSKFSEEYQWKPEIQTQAVPDLVETTHEREVPAGSTPLTVSIPQPPPRSEGQSEHSTKVLTRFGPMTNPVHAKLDRFHLTITNVLALPKTSRRKQDLAAVTRPPDNPRPKRKRRSMEDIEAGRDSPIKQHPPSSSLATTEVDTASNLEPAQMTLTFNGTDVFRGLRELALVDGGKYVDLERLPSWMTGEKGTSSWVVDNKV